MEVIGVVLLVAVGIAFGLLVAYDYVTSFGWPDDELPDIGITVSEPKYD